MVHCMKNAHCLAPSSCRCPINTCSLVLLLYGLSSLRPTRGDSLLRLVMSLGAVEFQARDDSGCV